MKTEDIIMESKHIGDMVPQVTFHTRVRDDSIEGPNPYTWQDMTSDDYFKGKKVIVFSLPGARGRWALPVLGTGPSPRHGAAKPSR